MRPLLVFLLLGGSLLAGGARADCLGGVGKLDYQLPNVWFDFTGKGPVWFEKACNAHDACYRALQEERLVCDERFKEDLDAACDAAFAPETHPNARCHRQAKDSYEYVVKNGGLLHRALERRAKADAQREQRAQDRAERRKERERERAERRRKAYEARYQELLKRQEKAAH